MEQLYLIEIFVDKVAIFAPEEGDNGSDKKLIIKVNFGPKVQFILKEGQLAPSATADEMIQADEQGHRKWSRTIRVGKSYLFPSYPDTVLMTLNKFPLEVEVWNDDEKEVEIFVGIGTMHWDTEFYYMLKEATNVCKIYEPIAIKQTIPLMAECCCRQVGEISFILRLSVLGDSIITEFQQLMSDPNRFCFRTNKAPSMFECKRVEGDDPNFTMVGSIYETTTLEDPDVIANANKKIEVCTELESCGFGQKGLDGTCHFEEKEKPLETFPIDRIRMGDITGPCGNTNCPLAHKIKTYIRNLEAYKKETFGKPPSEVKSTKKICGACDCKDDRWHRGTCKDTEEPPKPELPVCKDCGGIAKDGLTCDDKNKQMYGTGMTPKGSKTQAQYRVTTTTDYELMRATFGKDFVVGNVTTKYNFQNEATTSNGRCCCSKNRQAGCDLQVKSSHSAPNIKCDKNGTDMRRGLTTTWVYNAEVKEQAAPKHNFCLDIPEDKDCRCNPPTPAPPCKTFDCECISETFNIAMRKKHKPYCPSYKHKDNCPVTMLAEDEEGKIEFEEDEAEVLPYGLPPIQLGPCPVLGRPCTVPDGFARMYKIAAVPAQPPSYSDAGKVCCSKEYDRIKKAIKEYLKYQKDNDFRCINQFNVDTEKRCCDREQLILSLTGKSCCGSHKLDIQEKFKEEKK